MKKFLLLFLGMFSLVFGIIGVVMIGSACLQEKNSVLTEGEVIEYRRQPSHRSGHDYSPVVTYQAGDERITGETNVWSNTRPFQIGEHVTVGYDPERPDRFFIKEYSLKLRYQLGTIFLMISLGIVFAGLFFFLLGRTGMEQKKKEQAEAVSLVLGIVFFIFAGFWMLAGPAVTLCISAVIGLFGLYGWYDNRRKK